MFEIVRGVIQLFWGGWVLIQLWGWFIAPFFSIRQLTIPYAIGISLVVLMFKGMKHRELSNEEKLMEWVTSMVMSAIVLLFGWITSLFL